MDRAHASGHGSDRSIRRTKPVRRLDHYVELTPSVSIYNSLRVIANGAGSELSLTLFRRAEVNDARPIRCPLSFDHRSASDVS
jgi:hypothetical protein